MYTRLLRFGSRGADVKAVKDRLLALDLLHASTHDTFGSDTRRAVLRFQAGNDLAPDGVVGPLTWAALFPESAPAPAPAFSGALPEHIGKDAEQAIRAALSGVSDARLGVVLDALAFAFDPAVPAPYPRSLYIRGANLYNPDRTPYVVTRARIRSGAARQPQYYDGGRQEMMEAAVEQNPSITGADCSGGVVGLLRHAGLVPGGFDANADTLAARYGRAVARDALLPGDFLHKSGHIGLYAGGGYAVEWMGGAYGCQLTRLSARRGQNFVTGQSQRMGAWTGFVRPTYY